MTSDVVPTQTPQPATPQKKQERTIGDLLQRIDAAQERMSINNPHRRLLIECGHAVVEFANRMTAAEARATAAEAKLPKPAAEPQTTAV